MTGNDPDEHERSWGADVSAYALGALEPAEADAFRRHLETCPVCADELRAFQSAVADLAMSAPRYDAPPALRRRVLRAAADEPRGDSRARPPRRRALTLPRLPRLALALPSALAVVAAIVVVVVVLTTGGSSTRVIQAHVTGPGRAALRVAGGHGELLVRGFPQPPRGKVYEVWLQRGRGNPSPTNALFGVTANGNGDVDVPGSLHGVSQVMVTPEPAGGSRVPTHAPVITASLS